MSKVCRRTCGFFVSAISVDAGERCCYDYRVLARILEGVGVWAWHMKYKFLLVWGVV